MLELPMTAPGRDECPSVIGEKPQQVANLHRSSPPVTPAYTRSASQIAAREPARTAPVSAL